MNAKTTVVFDARNRLRMQKECQFVHPMHFRELLVSRKRLTRSDHARANLRGLIDLESGVEFLVEEEMLHAW